MIITRLELSEETTPFLDLSLGQMFVLEYESIELHVAWNRNARIEDFEQPFKKGKGKYEFYSVLCCKVYDTLTAKNYKVRLVKSICIRS